ncbi:hypothetical protein LUZ63_000490 [Rhynchospora breviuscula]|uniref:Uncharacterized protein n=1 Tax=Rhynchospora breviuscula TaxID=2022672 RepID=A0A9Q0CVA2_9POAL|nr:hypothetical protein LUZ63_000490 [Rhynchospora breviuscula]
MGLDSYRRSLDFILFPRLLANIFERKLIPAILPNVIAVIAEPAILSPSIEITGTGGTAMAKNRNKKKSTNQGVAPMDTSYQAFVTRPDEPQPMDTSEGKATNLGASSINRKINKGIQVRRTKNLRKKKSVARAISINEKNEEKVVRMKSKKIKIQSAKTLYE